MEEDFDMKNQFRIINLPDPISITEATLNIMLMISSTIQV